MSEQGSEIPPGDLDRETIALIDFDRKAGPRQHRGRYAAVDRVPRAQSGQRHLRSVEGLFRARRRTQGADVDHEHRPVVRPDPSPDGGLAGHGRERRLRHQARGLLHLQELGRVPLRRAGGIRSPSWTTSRPWRRSTACPRAAPLLPRGARRLGCRAAGRHRSKPDDGTGRRGRLHQPSAAAPTASRARSNTSFENSASFILAIETGGMFQRLQQHRFWKTANCILVEMGGVPTGAPGASSACLSDRAGCRSTASSTATPTAFTNIYRTLKVGSGNAAHLNRFFCVPHALPGRHAAGHHRLRA